MANIAQNKDAQAAAHKALTGADRLLNWKQVCGILGISRSTFYRMADEGVFGQKVYIGGSLRVYESAVERYIAQSSVNPLE